MPAFIPAANRNENSMWNNNVMKQNQKTVLVSVTGNCEEELL